VLNGSAADRLRQLGAGVPIATLCAGADITRGQFDTWWQAECAARVPEMQGVRHAPVRRDIEIVRDAWGIPHIFAQSDEELFFGYGLAEAQDRWWQLDYLRRKGLGRLAEILGPAALDQDVLARTVGFHRIAKRQLGLLPAETLRLLDAFARGVNAVREAVPDRDHLPVEFALLDYEPEPWSPLDSIAVWVEYQWYATGRIPVIVLPQVARQILGDDALFQAFLSGEASDESIVPRGFYAPRANVTHAAGRTIGDPDEGTGSNNWVVDGRRTASGLPLVASDPHVPFAAIPRWHEVHLCGGSFNVAGAGFAGVPAIRFGRNERVGWGLTNNICSQRDLYQERTDPQHPGCFLYDGQWEPERTLNETIGVKGAGSIQRTVRFSRNGPIADELLPAAARHTGPVSLRWMGATPCDELTCMLAANRARTCAEFREAFRHWRVPSWSLVFGDVAGHIGYQCTGAIPVRENWQRGYRPGWDPAHQWQATVPFDGLPALADPAHGRIASANNRTAPDDFPYPLSGTWGSGHRALRIRQMLEAQEQFAPADFARMQTDVLSLRAVEGVPLLLDALAGAKDERVRRAGDQLRAWDCRMETDRAGATIFDAFFQHWSLCVARERFGAEWEHQMAAALGGLASELLAGDQFGWFRHSRRPEAILASFNQALDDLSERLGPDLSQWQWGRLHTITLHHFLSERGDLGALLDRGGQPTGGNLETVCNTASDANYRVVGGATYRLIADLSTSSLLAVDTAGQSGHPGSAHYCDQLGDWLNGRYHAVPLARSAAEVPSESKLVLSAT
jgi:penicillin amidase